MGQKIKVTILGCGSSGGVPRVGGDWGACDPNNPKNRRTRCSIFVSTWQGEEEPSPKEQTSVLIDTSPDLREQCLAANIKHLDAVLYTHDHADQSHGIDDLRALAYRMRKRIPTYMDIHTKENVYKRFEYCFEMPEGRVHPPILELMPIIKPEDELQIDGPGGALNVKVLGLSHGPTPSLGFMFNDKIVYTPDVWDIKENVLTSMGRPDIWILDALRYSEHPTHAHADKALSWIARTQTRQAVLTNLHIDMDYETLSEQLTGQHCLSYDGMTLTL
ncbi:MAG: MBL fold metallo-hydrolase [Maricaulaceae bacterium]